MEGAIKDETWYEFVSKMLVYGLTLYMFSFEIFQVMDKKWSYFCELANWVDQISSLMVLGMLIKNDYFIESAYNIPTDLMLTAIVVALTWYKVFYWMKLFNTTAFFMNLLTKTFEDYNFQAFFIMTVILILAFANVIYILNINRGPEFIYTDVDGKNNDYIYPKSLPSSM